MFSSNAFSTRGCAIITGTAPTVGMKVKQVSVVPKVSEFFIFNLQLCIFPDQIDCTSYTSSVTTAYEAYNPNGYCVTGFIKCSEEEPICATPCNNETECSTGYDESTDIGCTGNFGCIQSLTATSSDQTFTSLNYPSNYDANSDCKWTISASS